MCFLAVFFDGVAFCFLEPAVLAALPSRVMGVMNNYVLISVPLFIFMGIMLERSGLAAQLLETMAVLMGRIRGGFDLAIPGQLQVI